MSGTHLEDIGYQLGKFDGRCRLVPVLEILNIIKAEDGINIKGVQTPVIAVAAYVVQFFGSMQEFVELVLKSYFLQFAVVGS